MADALVKAWNAFVKMPDIEADDLTDFRRAIHDAQRILQSRALARIFSDYWL